MGISNLGTNRVTPFTCGEILFKSIVKILGGQPGRLKFEHPGSWKLVEKQENSACVLYCILHAFRCCSAGTHCIIDD